MKTEIRKHEVNKQQTNSETNKNKETTNNKETEATIYTWQVASVIQHTYTKEKFVSMGKIWGKFVSMEKLWEKFDSMENIWGKFVSMEKYGENLLVWKFFC